MRRKVSWMILIVLLINCIILQGVGTGKAVVSTRLYLDPPTITGMGPGSTFSVNVNVENVVDLYSYSVRVNFDPTVVKIPDGMLDWIDWTTVMPDLCWLATASGFTADPPIVVVENDLGYIFVSQMLDPADAENGATGSGLLVTINFNVTGQGITELDLDPTKLNTVIAGNNVPIEHVAENGVFDNRVEENQPPVALFYAEPAFAEVNETITFNASASYDPDAWLVSYAWDFGDDTTEIYKGENLTDVAYHDYKHVGTCIVTLTVTDFYDGATASTTAEIAVGHDIAVTAVDAPSKTIVGATVPINVAVENQGAFTENLNVTVSYEATIIGVNDTVELPAQNSAIISFDWDTTGLTVGVYTINATATIPTIPVDNDPTDNSKTTIIKIVEHDVAVDSVTPYPTSVKLGELVNVTVVVENLGAEPETFNVTVYANENAIATENVTALPAGASRTLLFEWNTTYVHTGIYTISATATVLESTSNPTGIDDDPDDNTLIDGTVTVGEPPPVASFTYTPADPVVGETVAFDASASYDPDGTIVSYAWKFGDDTPGNGVTTTHTYDASGTYTVTLTVTDNSTAGLTDTAVFTVTVSRVALDVEVDVGSIHFTGEVAEFHVSVSRLGEPVNAAISATLYGPDNKATAYYQYPENITLIATGFYKITYEIPMGVLSGTYVLVVDASLLTLKGTSLKNFLISETLSGWNALLISINGVVGTIKTDVGLIEVKLDDIDASLVSIKGNITTINSTIGLIQTDTATINAEIIAINGKLATIQTDVGVIKADLDTVEARVTGVDGNIAAIQTTLGTINGTITSIQDDVATIETDIGTIKTTLEGWSGGATSPITTPLGDFRILVLTTSTLEGPIAFSDNVLAITLSGPSGTTGTTNVVIPKQLLVGIESSIEKVAVTIDDEQVIFTYTEKPETYLLQIAYTHSAHTIKVYLSGLLLTPFPWAVLIAILLVAIVAVAGVAVYILKIRKPRVASASKNTAAPEPTTLQP
jgi:PKD repeat protein